jgi:hypothetical protein
VVQVDVVPKCALCKRGRQCSARGTR